MRASISSTDQVVEMKDCDGKPFRSRVWEGVTDAGVKFVAYIPVVQVARDEDNYVFELELREHSAPSAATSRAIDMRFVL